MIAQLAQVQHLVTQLEARQLPWFDDNPYAWEGPDELFVDGTAGTISPWNLVTILTWTFTGKVDGKIGTKIDVKEKLGKRGATLTANGQAVRKHPIEVTLYIFTPQDLLNYLDLVQAVFQITNFVPTKADVAAAGPVANANTYKAVTVNNPRLVPYGVSQLFLYEAGLIDPPEGDRPASVKLQFYLYLTAPASQQATGSVSGSKGLAATLQPPASTPPAPTSPGGP